MHHQRGLVDDGAEGDAKTGSHDSGAYTIRVGDGVDSCAFRAVIRPIPKEFAVGPSFCGQQGAINNICGLSGEIL